MTSTADPTPATAEWGDGPRDRQAVARYAHIEYEDLRDSPSDATVERARQLMADDGAVDAFRLGTAVGLATKLLEPATDGDRTVAPAPVDVSARLAAGDSVRVDDLGSHREAVTVAAVAAAMVGRRLHLATATTVAAHHHHLRIEPLSRILPLSVSLVHDRLTADESRIAYRAQIVVGMVDRFAIDRLFDTRVVTGARRRQVDHDLVLVDDLATVILEEPPGGLVIVETIAPDDLLKRTSIARQLQRDVDYTIDDFTLEATLLPEGWDKVLRAVGEGRDDEPNLGLELVLLAKDVVVRDEHYVVRNGQVLRFDATVSAEGAAEGFDPDLQQALEAKEGVRVTNLRRTTGRARVLAYLQLYDELVGLCDTSTTDTDEIVRRSGLHVAHDGRLAPGVARKELVFRTAQARLQAAADAVVHHLADRPVVVFAEGDNAARLNGLLDGQGPFANGLTLFADRAHATIPFDGPDADRPVILVIERSRWRRHDDRILGLARRLGVEATFFSSIEDEIVVRAFRPALRALAAETWPTAVPLQSGFASEALDKAQQILEENEWASYERWTAELGVVDEVWGPILAFRERCLDGGSLRDDVSQIVPDVVRTIVRECCPGDDPQDWRLVDLADRTRTYWRSTLTADDLLEHEGRDELTARLVESAWDTYLEREADLTPEIMREVERTVAVRVVDQSWLARLQRCERIRSRHQRLPWSGRPAAAVADRELRRVVDGTMDEIRTNLLRYLMFVQVQVNRPASAPEGQAGNVHPDA